MTFFLDPSICSIQVEAVSVVIFWKIFLQIYWICSYVIIFFYTCTYLAKTLIGIYRRMPQSWTFAFFFFGSYSRCSVFEAYVVLYLPCTETSKPLKATVVPTKKGGIKVVQDGYTFYLRVKNNNNKTYWWHCNKKKKFNCKATAVTQVIDGEHWYGKVVPHNHPPPEDDPPLPQSLEEANVPLSLFETLHDLRC